MVSWNALRITNVRFGSLAAAWRPRWSTSALAHKADIQADGIIGLGAAAFGQKQSFVNVLGIAYWADLRTDSNRIANHHEASGHSQAHTVGRCAALG